MRFLLICLLLACGKPNIPHKAPLSPTTPRPTTVLKDHPECEGALTTGLVVNAGCIEWCLPQEAQRVCTDLGPRLYFPREHPLQGKYAVILTDPTSGCVPGWEIVEVNPTAHHYTNKDFEWATFPDNGAPCVIDEGAKVLGWFGQVHGTLDFHEFQSALLPEISE